MPEEIASDAALSFSPEAVHLQRRIGDEWREADHVRFDTADMRAGLARLRQGLAQSEDARPPVLLVIPDDQLLYTRLRVNADGPAAMPAAVARALEGLTPYAVEALAFDWLPAGPGQVHVAAVARQTLAEAEAFALRHGFDIRGFIADPDPERYPGEPSFIHPAAAEEEAIPAPPVSPERSDEAVAAESSVADAEGVLDEAPLAAPAETGDEGFSVDSDEDSPASAAMDEDDDAPVQAAVDHARLAASLDRLRALAAAAGSAAEAREASTDAAAAEIAPEAPADGVVAEMAAAAVETARPAAADSPIAVETPSAGTAPGAAASVDCLAETTGLPAVPVVDAGAAPTPQQPVAKAADPVITRIPPSVSYPVAAKAEAAAKPQKAARLGGQHRPAVLAPIEAAAPLIPATPTMIVRHGESEAAANDPLAPVGLARRLLAGRHGPLNGLVALLLAAMLLIALFAGRGGQQATLAENPASARPEATATPAATVAESTTRSAADQVQAAADDALGNALRQALAQPAAPTEATAPAQPVASAAPVPASQAQPESPATAPRTPATAQPSVVAASPAQSGAAIAVSQASTLPVAAPPAVALVPPEAPPLAPQPVEQVAAPAPAPAPVPASAASAQPAAPLSAPAAAIPASPAPQATTSEVAAPPSSPTVQSAPVVAEVPAPRAAPAPSVMRPAAKPPQRPVAAAASPAPQAAARPAPVAAQAAAVPRPAPQTASAPASRPAARPATPPRRASPAAIPAPAATPAAQLQRSIRPPTRPTRSGALLLRGPAIRFAFDMAPPGLDPAAFAIPARIAVARLPDSTDAPRYAQMRPTRKPGGGGASAVDAALREAVAAPSARPGAGASTVPGVASTMAATTAAVRPGQSSGRPARKPGGGGTVPRTDEAAVESAIASAIQASTVPPRADPAPVPGVLRSSALPPRRSGMALASAAPAIAAGVAVPDAGTRMAAASGPDTTAQIAAAAQAAQDAAAAERRRIDEDLQAQAETRIRARADADTQTEARARAQAEARARAQAEAEERAARARGGSYRPTEIDDEPEIADTGGGTTSQTVAQNATIRRGLDINRTTLIGVIGAGKASRGLIRLRNGRIVTVRIGDRIDGGTITGIGDGAVTYAVGGRPRQLKILDGR